LSDLDAALFIAGDNDATRALNTTLAEVSGKLAQNDKPRAEALGLYVQAHLAEWEYFQLQSTRKKQPMASRQTVKKRTCHCTRTPRQQRQDAC
jgi:hypothetical protein